MKLKFDFKISGFNNAYFNKADVAVVFSQINGKYLEKIVASIFFNNVSAP